MPTLPDENRLCPAQETADGELVVLHDLPSLLAASLGSACNAAAAAALRAIGVNPATARVEARTWPLHDMCNAHKEGFLQSRALLTGWCSQALCSQQYLEAGLASCDRV